ncbi:E3 ubiquitin-protein ligase [Canna indica]|uniref:RING-type E3 ubiquitin transferase n=1 Tax=Canna indica TaxID=4628 RepID=A0AAQ3JQS7_9LILI|nr:E3 ubiquitin-protein ligase [Canna indica]
MEHSGSLGRSGGGGTTSGRTCRSSAPLLHHHHHHSRSRGRVNWSLPIRLGRATARRLLAPAPPAAVAQDRYALQLEEHHCSWGYSKPVVVVDVVWNSAFVLVSAAVLLSTATERPETPIRAWVFGYALQCLLHVGFVCFEYKRRRRIRERRNRWAAVGEEEDDESRAVKKLESLNSMISLLWWMLGFYWIVVGGQTLLQDAPRLYWLTVVFLAFDVFFAIFCVMLACVIGIALCCCLPCFIAFLHAVADQDGASDTDLSTLPKFRFCQSDQPDKLDLEREHQVSITIRDQDSIIDLFLRPEDSECCICLSKYEDGAELHSLPCSHHFHSDCIVKWLKINATCPLCKQNIFEDEDEAEVH